jgi:hypothetical protein
MAFVVLCVSSLLEFYENVNKLRAIGYEVAAEGYAKVFLGLLILLLTGLCSFWIAANLSKADTMLGEIFRKCPLCSVLILSYGIHNFDGKKAKYGVVIAMPNGNGLCLGGLVA